MPTKLRCGWSPIADLLADSALTDLLDLQWSELSFEHPPPSPDYERALEYERSGFLKVWTARERGELRGFIQWQFVSPLGYPSETWAFDVGWYFDPKQRNAFKALLMWRAAADALRALGVTVMRGHDNTKKPMPGFFGRLGMRPIATLYERGLG